MGVYFRGFSTVGSTSAKSWTLTDIDLVNQDLSNAFNTRVGERVMRPDLGCRIWDYAMEPLTNDSYGLIVQEARRICAADQRVEVLDISVTDLPLGVQVSVTLNYVPLSAVGTFQINFENRQTAYFSGTSTE